MGRQTAKMSEASGFFSCDRSAALRHAFIMTLVLAFCAAGCGRSGSTTTQENAVKRYGIATVYPMAAIVREIAGNRMEVVWKIDWLCENGLDPRDLQLTDEQRRDTRRCDLMFTSGFGDKWAGDMLNVTQRAEHVVELASTPAGMRYGGVHGALWLDVGVMKQFAEQARERLTVNDPRHEAEYRQNAADFTKSLDALEAEYRSKLAPLWGRKFLSLRRTWQPMVLRFGLEEVSPVDTDPQKMTDEDVKALKQAAKEKNIGILAIDSSLLPGVQRELQLRTGLTLMPLDLVGTSAPDGRSTYVKMMRYNLDQLVEALK
jgi:zinc transport system substrate-binding protein